MKTTKVLAAIVLVLSLLLAWSVIAKGSQSASFGDPLVWEKVNTKIKMTTGGVLYRAEVPNGWLVIYPGQSVTFVPDRNHTWQQ